MEINYIYVVTLITFLIINIFYSFKFRALGTQTMTIDSLRRSVRNKNLCKALYLHSHQRQVCQNYTDLIPSVAEGVRLSIDECQEQFRNRKWNCSIEEKGTTVFGAMIRKGKYFLNILFIYCKHFRIN